MNNFEEVFKQFIHTLPDCKVLEDVFEKEYLKQFSNADYFLKNREIVSELKCLEQDSVPRLQELINELMETRGKIFYGEMGFDKYIKDFPDENKLNEKAIRIVTHSLKKHIAKANRQIYETKKKLCLNESSGLFIVVNVNNKALTPKLAKSALLSLLRTNSIFGKIRYENISACIYISEAHLSESNLLLFLIIERDRSKAKELTSIDIKYLEGLQEKWARFKGVSLIKGTEDMIDKIKVDSNQNPRPKKRSEVWREEYRKNRYLGHLNDKELVEEIAKYIKEAFLIKDTTSGKYRYSMGKDDGLLAKYTHYMEESNLRGLDFSKVGFKLKEFLDN